MVHVVPIVEGHGEVEAVPALPHRMADIASPGLAMKVNHPIRVKSGSFLRDNAYFNKQVLLASAKAAQPRGFILVLT